MRIKSLFITFVTVVICSLSQVEAKSAEVKVNVLAGAVTIFNPSLEVSCGENSSLVFDYMGAYAKDDFMGMGYPLMFSMGLFEYRYYLGSKEHSGLFLGGNVGIDTFRMNKNILPAVAHDHADESYDVGQGFLIGVTIGYKYNFAKRWGVEASVTGGWSHSQHEGYNSAGERQFELNASAEWLPYKAGIYINYRLWE